MNIDVREYLRINPISVHDLTLSDNGDDCFLFFYKSTDQNDEVSHEYYAKTQTQLFNSIYKSIFGDLVCIGDDGKIRFKYTSLEPITWDENVHLSDDQFKEYARKSEFNSFKSDINGKMNSIENELNERIMELKQGGILDYGGAVELMSRYENLYMSFKNALGGIWCYDGKNELKNTDDRVELTDIPIHSHPDTKAEALTHPIASSIPGGDVLGIFSEGSEYKVSEQLKTSQSRLGTRTIQIDGDLTYPLQGLNILDWRNVDRTHNNVPPSYNIFIRYKDSGMTSRKLESRNSDELIQDDEVVEYPEYKVDLIELAEKYGGLCSVEAHYESNFVDELEKYEKEYLTEHDYILRIETQDNDMELKKQTIDMLSSIFSKYSYVNLGSKLDNGNFIPINDILKVILDKELLPINEYYKWVGEFNKQLNRIKQLMIEFMSLLIEVKPISYPGRIIISTTDDIESKVIKNYGGRKWKRVVNFLRGVDLDSTELGVKFGEAYVELRESNVPNHTHEVRSIEIDNEEILVTNGIGESKMLNSSNNDGSIGSSSLVNGEIEYQISPLEYSNRDSIVLPHDNIPPYREVYIWECVEGDDYYAGQIVSDEIICEQDDDSIQQIVCDIIDNEDNIIYGQFKLPEKQYSINYDMNGHGSVPQSALRIYDRFTHMPYMPDSPSNVNGYAFIGWSPKQIDDGTQCDFKFTARWEPIQYKIKWNMNGHGSIPWNAPSTYTIESDTYIPDEPMENGWTFKGWTPSSIPHGSTGDVTFTANWD